MEVPTSLISFQNIGTSIYVNYTEQRGSFWSELTGFCHCQTWEVPMSNLPIDTEFITPSVVVL